jgi:hypothetical protein
MLPRVRVVVSVDGPVDDDVVAQLDARLRSSPALTGVEVRRGRAEIGSGELGATEVVTFLATNVALPLVLTAIYDFFRDRRRSHPADSARVTLTRTDVAGVGRTAQLRLEGPAETVVEVARKALEEPNAGG